ncbi:MAG: hypothetical protein QM401_00190, partial [Bacillota bacterium]|nr:hypothetical protein [Bacillota bacterium]
KLHNDFVRNHLHKRLSLTKLNYLAYSLQTQMFEDWLFSFQGSFCSLFLGSSLIIAHRKLFVNRVLSADN